MVVSRPLGAGPRRRRSASHWRATSGREGMRWSGLASALARPPRKSAKSRASVVAKCRLLFGGCSRSPRSLATRAQWMLLRQHADRRVRSAGRNVWRCERRVGVLRAASAHGCRRGRYSHTVADRRLRGVRWLAVQLGTGLNRAFLNCCIRGAGRELSDHFLFTRSARLGFLARHLAKGRCWCRLGLSHHLPMPLLDAHQRQGLMDLPSVNRRRPG